MLALERSTDSSGIPIPFRAHSGYGGYVTEHSAVRNLQLTIGAIIGTIVRLCFAIRVWRFSQHNKIVTATVVMVSLSELVLAIAYTVKSLQTPFLSLLPNYKVLASFSLSVGVITDIFTVTALCFFLCKFRTGHARVDSLANTLTIYAVNTGAITAVVGPLTLILVIHLLQY
ncbi:hypothetical protein B0H19DRAFT_1276542 [Mycena capillaripes]|nr:hypothetical protein B0H19DRAFT_1276542 [Mycena capillaripes]